LYEPVIKQKVCFTRKKHPKLMWVCGKRVLVIIQILVSLWTRFEFCYYCKLLIIFLTMHTIFCLDVLVLLVRIIWCLIRSKKEMCTTSDADLLPSSVIFIHSNTSQCVTIWLRSDTVKMCKHMNFFTQLLTSLYKWFQTFWVFCSF
jgi:hypothetical protein